MLTSIILIAIALMLVIFCGIFVAAEFAFITVDKSTVERAAEHDKRARGVLAALRSLSTQLSGAQIGITATNLAIGFLAEPGVAKLLERPLQNLGISHEAHSSLAFAIAVLIVTAVTMVFGELVPKNIALARPLGVAKLVQGFQRGFSASIYGVIISLNAVANGLLRLFQVEPQEELASARSADELSSLVRHSAEKGTLPKATAEILERTLEFGDLIAADVMTPRVRIHAVTTDTAAAGVIALARSTGHSRFPVIGEGMDDVVGIVHIKHAMALTSRQRSERLVEQIMQKAIAVPSTIKLDPLLTTLRQGGMQMAVVIDEFGGTDGIVTIEDLIEELVGEVQDEHDAEARPVRELSNGAWILSGLLRTDEASDVIGVRLPESQESDTLAGLISERIGRVPSKGDHVIVRAIKEDGSDVEVALTVKRMDGRRVDRLHATVSPPITEDAS